MYGYVHGHEHRHLHGHVVSQATNDEPIKPQVPTATNQEVERIRPFAQAALVNMRLVMGPGAIERPPSAMWSPFFALCVGSVASVSAISTQGGALPLSCR